MKRPATIIKERQRKGDRPEEIKSYLRGYYVPTGSVKPKPKQIRAYREGLRLLEKETDK